MIFAFLATTGLALVTVTQADGGNPTPASPELIKRLETPAKISVDGDTLYYDGIIVEVSVAEVGRLLGAANAKSIRSIVIKSPGGTAEAGLPFGELVRDGKLSVTIDGYCMSACANYVAIAAHELVVPDGALLGFHGGPSKIWGDDGEYTEAHKKSLRAAGVPDKFFPGLLQHDKENYARQQALYQSLGVSLDILEDTAAGKIAPVTFWMFTREALERCYNLRNIKQYPTLVGDQIVDGKSTIKIVRNCPGKTN